jgi:glycosyltransferase involved in cell wall biosynthesis
MFSALANKGVYSQDIFVPIRNCKHHGINRVDDSSITYNYVYCLSIFTRFFYFLKLLIIFIAALKLKKQTKKSTVIHAHTLYADGVPAFLYSALTKSKLIIAVRNTDVNSGFKYYWHYKWLARKALAYSTKIIFISPAHKVKFQQYFGSGYDDKLMVVPNGIDKLYFQNIRLEKLEKQSKIIALHIAYIDKNKNLKNTINAFFDANSHADDAEFRVVGGLYKEYSKLFGELPKNIRNKVFFLGKLNINEVLIQMNEASIFIMVSHHETFGLVYIEAMSQCLPIVYTQGQGVDGYFKDGQYGFSASSQDVASISLAIKKTMEKFPNGLGRLEYNPAEDFCWQAIASKYVEDIYK